MAGADIKGLSAQWTTALPSPGRPNNIENMLIEEWVLVALRFQNVRVLRYLSRFKVIRNLIAIDLQIFDGNLRWDNYPL